MVNNKMTKTRGWEVDALEQFIEKTSLHMKQETTKCLQEAVFRSNWSKQYDKFIHSWNKYIQLNQTKNYVVKDNTLKTAINIANVLHRHEKWQYLGYSRIHSDVYKSWVDEVIENARECLAYFNVFYCTENDYNYAQNCARVIDVLVVSLPLYLVHEFEIVNQKTVNLNLGDWGNIILLLCRLKDPDYIKIINKYIAGNLGSENYHLSSIINELNKFLLTCTESVRNEIQSVINVK